MKKNKPMGPNLAANLTDEKGLARVRNEFIQEVALRRPYIKYISDVYYSYESDDRFLKAFLRSTPPKTVQLPLTFKGIDVLYEVETN